MITAAVIPAPNQPVELRQLPDPVMEQGSILLETIASEVCGTDVHLFHGKLAGVPYPLVPGHVSVGRVIESRGVRQDALGKPLRVGDVVTFYDVHGICGECWQCAVAKQPNRCPKRRVYGITFGANDGPLGGWAERIYLKPGVKVLSLPEALSADDVIAGGCGLNTGYAAIDRSRMAAGDTVVVQGAGPVGLGAAIVAGLRGAGQVITIGDPPDRLALATLFGAGATLSVSASGAAERASLVRDATDGRGADVVIEATGNPAAVPEGLELLRDGGTYVIAGHYTDTGSVSINPHVINRKHATVLGQWGTDYRHVTGALALLAEHRGRVAIDRIIGRRYLLAEAGRALADVEGMNVTKAIIEPNRKQLQG